MLALRLGRGGHALVQVRRLLVAAASAGVGFLLLCTLGWAVDHPAGSAVRLLWSLVPVVAAAQFAAAVGRTDPGTRARSGLSAVGLGPARLSMLAATSAAVTCALGSAVALLSFLHLRGDLAGPPFTGEGAELLAPGRPLPLGAALMLLAVVPVLAGVTTWYAVRAASPDGAGAARSRAAASGTAPGRASSAASTAPSTSTSASASADVDETDTERPRTAAPPPPPSAAPAAPAGLPWGIALTAAGFAIETYASRGGGTALPLPGRFDGSPAGVLAGWSLTAVGLALAGPGLTHLCGLLLQTVRPGAVRLLAGRMLMAEAHRIGRPLGVLCAVLSGVFAAATLYGPGDERPFGPLTALGATLVVGCTAATALMAALESRQTRAALIDSLYRLGAPAAVLRTAAVVRTVALLALFAPLTWAVAALAAVPLTR
ncbi:hypothetical protein [Streptomyces sp. NRRL F-5135]|uniref:hypothetical protein n=1 Tax=Streptomyces sp. NRRL F-5135 TaxID=1463858 RepID=UPI0004CA556C|nr:hypothetical protein [Streptomyces sp. NRRL F-5135]